MVTKQGSSLIPLSSDEEIKTQFLYMKHLIFYSKLIYMWPTLRHDHGVKYHVIVCFVTINFTLTALSFFIQILKEYKNLDSATDLVDFVTVITSATFRFCYIYFRGPAYLKLVHLIHTNFIYRPFIPSSNRVTLHRYYKLANKIVLAYSVFIFFWVLQICVVPLINYVWAVSTKTNASEVIPYPIVKNTYAPFDIHIQPYNGLFFAHQTLVFVYFGWIYMVVDSFWYMVIILTIGQFALIKSSIKTMTEILNDESMEDRLMGKGEILQIEAALKRCIKHHQFVREFTHMIDNISNPLILVDYLHGIISIGFILLNVKISLNLGEWNKLMYSMEYFITSIVHMFFLDWLGNELAEKEEELSGAVYEIPWYKCPKLKANLFLISIQSRRPYRLTGGRIYKLTLDFFTSTIKAVFSYFTFLLQLRDK